MTAPAETELNWFVLRVASGHEDRVRRQLEARVKAKGLEEKVPRILAVTGAKGGAGKTVVASNLAIYLATIGRSVVIIDADAEGASVRSAPSTVCTLAPSASAIRSPCAGPFAP